MSIEVQREGEVEFSKPFVRALFRDSRLSFSARGLFAFLWDLPKDWRIRSTWLAARGPEGKDAIRARLAELRVVGAIRIEPIRENSGKVAGTRWVLISPQTWAQAAPLGHSTESGIPPLSDIPTVGKPAAKVHPVDGSPITSVAAAQDAAADAAAAGEVKRRHPLRAADGNIEVWFPSEDALAEYLIRTYSAEQIAKAASTIRAVLNQRGRPTSPVPALVKLEIERQVKADLSAERRCAATHTQAADQPDVDYRERGRRHTDRLKAALMGTGGAQ